MILVKITILAIIVTCILVWCFKIWANSNPIKALAEKYPWWVYLTALLIVVDIFLTLSSAIYILFFAK